MQLKSLFSVSAFAIVGSAAAVATAAPQPTLAPRHNNHDGSSYINYTTVTGFFLQDEATTDPSTFDYVCILLTKPLESFTKSPDSPFSTLG
jgi:hypothetical protein